MFISNTHQDIFRYIFIIFPHDFEKSGFTMIQLKAWIHISTRPIHSKYRISENQQIYSKYPDFVKNSTDRIVEEQFLKI